MSNWKCKALEACPELREELEASQGCMFAWFELLPMVRQYELDQESEKALAIYSFARWCWDQPAHQNAVAVAFYEHLVDDVSTLAVLPQRLKNPKHFAALIPLFEQRISQKKLTALLTEYDKVHKTKFARYRS